MKFKLIEQEQHYDGSQLRSLFSYLEHGLLGDSIVSWTGSCDVSPAKMIDGEDLKAGSQIRGAKMQHFIVEKFNCDLLAGVFMQRLLSSLALDIVREHAKIENPLENLKREGDDIYFKNKKFSISIATVSKLSSLVHFAVNISNDGTPVETCSLEDFALDQKVFAKELMTRFCREVESSIEATQKVFTV